MLKISDNIKHQRDFRIPSEKRIIDYIRNDGDIDSISAVDTVMVISRSDQIFELNLAGSIIFEGIKHFDDDDTIVNELSTVFNASESVLRVEYSEFVNKLVSGGFVVEE